MMYKSVGSGLFIMMVGCASHDVVNANLPHPHADKEATVQRMQTDLTLYIGMNKKQAIDALQALNAQDFSAEMSTIAVEWVDGQPVAKLPDEPAKEVMWAIPGYESDIETVFVKGKLSRIHHWDTTKPSSRKYHHMREYVRVSNITFKHDGVSYDRDVIEIVPEW